MLVSLLEHCINAYFSLIPRALPPTASIKQARLIAHRGAHKNAAGIIENTQEAFGLAKKLKFWGIELDVRATADKVLVVHHDPTLKRLWGQNLAIAQLEFSQLRAIAPKIPTLAEVVAAHGKKMHLMIELKHPFVESAALFEVLHELTPCQDYHLLSLHAPQLKQLKQFPKESLLLVPMHYNVKKFCKLSLKENYGGVLGNYLLLTNACIHKINKANQVTGVGFVNSKYSLYRELNRGIAWLFTNNAEKVSRYLQDLR